MDLSRKLVMEHPTTLLKIHVDTGKDGIVYLSGNARTPEAIDKAISIARATENVKSVSSTVTVKLND
jgi:hyperosmotically inducible protein